MSEQKVGLLLKTTFLPPLDEGGSLAGNEIAKTFDSDPDASDIAPNLFQPIFEKAQENQFNQSSVRMDAGLDAPMTTRRGTRYAKGTRGHDLGIASTEEVIIDGQRWVNAYDAAGTLVDAREIHE